MVKQQKPSIYLDYHATTPLDPRVLEKMIPYFCEHFGNAASSHSFGKKASEACEVSRQQIAKSLGAFSKNIFFTSGATESNNLVIKGVAKRCASFGRHIISCVTEHKSILDPLRHLEGLGFEVSLLSVDANGSVNLDELKNCLRLGSGGVDRTVLVTLMGANNEIGTIHPVAKIARILKGHGILFHVDGAQWVGKVDVDVQTCGVDFLSLSGHKIYGPKGIGALYVSDRVLENGKIQPEIHGGGQECGMRAGTLPVPLIVGIGSACELATQELADEKKHLMLLREKLWYGLVKLGDCKLNGHPSERLAGNLNVAFADLDGDRLMLCLRHVAVSSSSACSAAKGGRSHVLEAIGLSEEESSATVRFGLGRFTTEEEIAAVLRILNESIPRLRNTNRKLKKLSIGKSPLDRPQPDLAKIG